MSIQLQIEERPGYLTAKFIGAGAAEETWGQFESIAEHCKRANKNKLLLDVTQARAEIYLADRYFYSKGRRVSGAGEMAGQRMTMIFAEAVRRFGTRLPQKLVGRFGTCPTPEPAKCPTFNTVIDESRYSIPK